MRSILALLVCTACVADDDVSTETLAEEEGWDTAAGPISTPSSYHVVHIDDVWAWDAIRSLAETHAGPIIASQNRPVDLSPAEWTQNVSVLWYATGAEMAADVAARLSGPNAPARIMVDELRTASIGLIAELARTMAADHPELRGRWGAYLVHGTGVAYPNLNPAVDALLDAGAPIAVELYAKPSEYCAAGPTSAARDQWLADFYHGDRGAFPAGRFHWLAQRRAARGSTSELTVLFGVTDSFLDLDRPALFLDRLFYVWATRSGYRRAILLENGGPGAWKWDQPFTSNTSRDIAFAESFQHYSVEGRTSSRLGPVDCP